ncbi:MAG: hypothetical protein WCA78_02485 [Rhizomicrobium sp.]|jgi:hypothetical protein
MSDELSAQLLALYRNTAREVPDEKLDRAILGNAHAVAWRRRNRAPLLTAASCTSLAIAIALWSAAATTKPHPALDTAEFGMNDGRAPSYAMNANASVNREPGMDANPGLTAGMWTKPDVD